MTGKINFPMASASRATISLLSCLVALTAVHPRAGAQDKTLPIHTTAVPAVKRPLSAEQLRSMPRSYFHQQLRFEPNSGQAAKLVQFVAKGHSYSLFLTPADAVLRLDPKGAKSATLQMIVVDANPDAPVAGREPLTSHSNYLIGNDPAKWQTNVPNFARVNYQGIYPGVDLAYYGKEGKLEYDFTVAPNADPSRIGLEFKGMERMHLDASGELALDTAAGPVRLERPTIYQQGNDGRREPVQGGFVLGGNRASFWIGEYDRSRALVIDPVVAYATYLGSEDYTILGNENFVTAIAADSIGNVYLTGITNETSFPITGTTLAIGPPSTPDAAYTFITKFNPQGQLIYSTILGGSKGDNNGAAIAVDSSGAVYVAGQTLAADFPVTPGAFMPTYPANVNFAASGFVVKLNGNDSSFIYSTFMGGASNAGVWAAPTSGAAGEQVLAAATAIAVDENGNAYVAGYDLGGFPTTSGAFQSNQPSQGQDYNPFIAKIAGNGQSLLYGTYLGGSNRDIPTGIAIDGAGNAYVTGTTESTNFPTGPIPIQAALAGNQNAFVSKLNAAGTGLIYSTYLGGENQEFSGGIAVDAAGEAYVDGATTSPNFPLVSPIQSTISVEAAYTAKINAAGSALMYSTFLGGGTGAEGAAIAVDSAGNAYITGTVLQQNGGSGPPSPFPTLNPLPINNPSGQSEAFVAEFSPAGALLNSTMFGGNTGPTFGTGIAVDSFANIYLAGVTQTSDIPVTPGAQQAGLEGTANVFVAKLWPIAISPYPQNLQFPNTAVGSTNTIDMAVTNTSASAFSFSGLALGGANSNDFSVNSTCGASVAPFATCYIALTFTPNLNQTYNATLAFALTGVDGIINDTFTTITGTGTGQVLALLTPSLNTFQNSDQTLTAVLDNPGNLPLMISSIGLTGTNANQFTIKNDCGGDLPANSSCEINVRYRPTSAPPAGTYFTGFVTVTDNAATPTQYSEVTGPAPIANLAPAMFNFPATAVGSTSAAVPVTLSNSGYAPLYISSIALTGASAGNFAETDNCPPVLHVGATCTLSIAFKPTVAGTWSASVTVSDNSVVSQSVVNFSGNAISPQALLSTTLLVFPNTAVGGDSPSQTVTLSNPGTDTLNISSIRLGGRFVSRRAKSNFSEENTCGATLAPGQSCTISAKFNPVEVGNLSSNIFIEDDAAGSPQTIALGGYSAVPTVSLSKSVLDFPSTPDGLTPTLPVNVTNTSVVPLTMTTLNLTGHDVSSFATYSSTCTGVLAPGATCTLTIEFRPATVGYFSAKYTITDNASPTTQSVELSGTGTRAIPIVQITAPIQNPLGMSFTVPSGQLAPSQSIQIQNVGSATLTGLAFELSNPSVYHITGNTCAATLGAGQSCSVSVDFAPTTPGIFNAALIVEDNAADAPQDVILQGTSQVDNPKLLISTPKGTFFAVNYIGDTYSLPVTIANIGNIPISISSIKLTEFFGGSDFSLDGSCPIAPATLPVGQSCQLTVVVDPPNENPIEAEFQIFSNAPPSPVSIEFDAAVQATPTT